MKLQAQMKVQRVMWNLTALIAGLVFKFQPHLKVRLYVQLAQQKSIMLLRKSNSLLDLQ